MRPAHIPSRLRLGHVRLRELLAAAAFAAAAASVLWAGAGVLLRRPPFASLPPWCQVTVLALGALGLACAAYAVLVEPRRLTVTRLTLRSPKVRNPVRLAHVSDAHVRRWTPFEDQVLDELRGLRPDLILVTGDLGAHPIRREDVRRLLGGLAAIAPTYCSRGNFEYLRLCPVEALQGAGAVWLLNAKADVRVGETDIELSGADPGDESAVRSLSEGAAPGAFSVCLYHYPDLVPELERLRFDLMLCGHTHGGQIVLPALGPLISLSRAGTRYAQGLFRAGTAAAYVSRGLGCESFGLPRIRFRCPPELVCITLAPGG